MNSSEPAPASGRGTFAPIARVFPLACILLLGVGLSLGAFYFIRGREQARIEQEFEWHTRSHLEALRTHLERSEECLYTLRDLFQSASYITPAKFKRTAEDLRARHRGVQQLEWVPRVRANDRATFLEQTRQKGPADYQIREPKRELGAPGRASESEDYAPVLYVDPMEGHEVALGYDAYQGSHRAVLDRARDQGTIAATCRIAMREPTGKEFGWVAFLPVFAKGAEPATPQERQERLLGFTMGAFRLTDLVANSFPDATHPAVEAWFVDETPGSPERFLVAFANGVIRTPSPAGEAPFATGLHRTETLPVEGREWRVIFRPAPAWLAAQVTPYPQATLILGLLITGLVAVLVHSAQRRAVVVGRLVEERTAELGAAQESLREDIARREIVETALRQSEDRYRAFIEQSSEGVWCYEYEPPIPTHLPAGEQIELMYRSGRLSECNDVMARMYGYEHSEQLVGVSLETFHPRNEPQSETYFRAFIEHGYRVSEWESREVDKDGNVRYFLTNRTGIVEEGLLKRSWGTQSDITERKRQAEIQSQQATRLRLAVTAANLGTWDWDLVTQRVIWSPETERMFGLEPGAFDGKLETYLSYLYPEDRERVGVIIRRALQTPGETGTDYELRIRRSDGTTRWIVARGAVVRDAQGQPVRMLGTVMDVTHQQLAEEERARMERKLQDSQKLESLGVLAGGIAHDFNNLLTGILGNASFARMDIPTNSPAQSALEQVELAAQRAAELCKQMLAYSGKGRFVVRQLDLSQLVRETADLLQVSIDKKCVLKYALAAELPAISADATQLRQIIMNLVINASEAIGDKSGIISIATGVMQADRAYLTEAHLSPNIPEGEYVFLEVSDNGAGMSSETRAKIFDPFFTTKFTGRGLGLAAVLGIVRGHKGALKVYSEPGCGTTFKLLLPRAEGPADSSPDAPAGKTGRWRGSGTMLVVDDEATVRLTTRRMLERIGFDVLEAADGREALEVFHRDSAKIAGVLLDLTMPQLDGNATFTELRRLEPGVRVLLMSGFNEQDAVHRFAGKGLSGFIQKPFKLDTLSTKLEAIFAETAPAAEPAHG